MSIGFEAWGHVALITIDRPEARNAIDAAAARDLEAAIDRLEADDSLWVGVLTGSPPSFCAGADLRVLESGGLDEITTERGGFAGLVRRERTKPLIAAVVGAAFAGGFEIVLACDLVVAAADSRFGLPEVSRALIAGAGGLVRLPTVVPKNVAMEMALTGLPVDAATAARLGIVNRVVETDEVVDAAIALAVQRSRQVLLAAIEQGPEAAWELSAQGLREMVATEDFTEGPRAFLEKRPPVWKGC
jgi:enoyl-CoA hydratase